MTKQEILEYFKDINHAYNESTRLDDLSHMLDELMQGNSDKDCISREQALKCFTWTNTKDDVYYSINALPSIQPKPKTGHWIKHENPNYGQCELVSYECSSCGVWLGCQYFSRRSYCPNCGAKMESEDKE